MIISFLYVFITFFLDIKICSTVNVFFFKNLRITAKFFLNALGFVGTKLLLVFSHSYSR